MRSTFTWRPRRFARDEEGAVTIEAVLWIPFFFALLMLITDASLAFFSRAEAMRVIEIGNRAFAVDGDLTAAAAETWIEGQFAAFAPHAQATTATASVTDDLALVATTLQYPAREVVMFNTLGVMNGWTITVRAAQFVERELE